MTSNSEDVREINLIDITNENHSGFLASYEFNGKSFEILAIDTPPEGYKLDDALEIELIDRFEDVAMHDGTDPELDKRQHDYNNELMEKIQEIALPKFRKLSPSPVTSSIKKVVTIQEYLYPEVIKLQLVTINGSLTVIDGHHAEFENPNEPISRETLLEQGFEVDGLAHFPAGDVIMGPRYSTGLAAWEATVKGEQYVAKMAGVVLSIPLVRELSIFAKIQKANFDRDVRISSLKGLITHNGGVAGYLITKIPVKYATLTIALGQIIDGIQSLAVMEKWAAQIEYSLLKLHKQNIIWGDAKPDNILIDKDDNAWIIDFGGGFTEGWVDEDLAESVEGDLAALAKIKKELSV